MKRKVWASSPVFYLIAALMFGMACVSWFFSHAVFYAEVTVSAVAFAAVWVAVGQFQTHVATVAKSTLTVLTGEQYRLLQGFRLPVAVAGQEGDIIWANPAFLKTVAFKAECRGENLLKYIYPKTPEEILGASGTDIAVDERRYTVFGLKTASGFIFYFVDDTDFKEVSLRYRETRPVVVLAYFDNREELSRDSSGSDDVRITSEVEEVLIHWAQNLGGFMKKLSNGRYFILTDEENIRGEMSKRFPVLDTVRGIRLNERLGATVSIGVARGASSMQEADAWARNALEMALGRGGDQVAVKQQNDTYEFFGGLSKGVEKRDKVRTRVFAATLSDDIKASDAVLIMGHKFSDLDCMGASVGIWSAASKALDKPAHIVVDESQSLAQPVIKAMQASHPDEGMFISPQAALQLATQKTMLVVVDTHTPDFVESPELLKTVSRVVVIDHHRMMVHHIENALIFYHEPYASSASEMVAELVQYLGDKELTPPEAEAMMAGIMLDTKNFVLKTGVRTFEAAAYLRRKGADTVRVKRMFSDSIEAYKAKFRIVSNAEIVNGFAVAFAEKEYPDIRISAAQAADELLSIQGVDASFVVYPAGGTISISARSLGKVNVQLIMEVLGGGGHMTMAGVQLQNVSVEQARQQLIAAIRKNAQKSLEP